MSRLIGEEEPAADEVAETHTREEEAIEKRISLAEQRIGAIIAALRSSDAKRVLDLGCGEGRLLRELLKDKAFTEIVGMDVSHRALAVRTGWMREAYRLGPGERVLQFASLGFDTHVEEIFPASPSRPMSFRPPPKNSGAPHSSVVMWASA